MDGDDDSGDDDDVENAKKGDTDKKKKQKVVEQPPKKEADSEKEDDDSEDDEPPVDDEEMFRLDGQLAEAMRKARAAKTMAQRQAKERIRQVADFKAKLFGMLETVLRQVTR